MNLFVTFVIDSHMKRIISLFCCLFCSFIISAQGIITTVAGGGNFGDGVIATQAALDKINDVVVDTNGNMYIAEETAIRKVDANTQIINLYAGSYQSGIGCDSCAATTAKLSHASAIAFDKQGNLYIADWGSGRIRKVDAVTGIMTTYAGNGTIGYSGDGGQASLAQFHSPVSTCLDKENNLYIADQLNYRIRKITGFTAAVHTLIAQNFGVFPNPSQGLFDVFSEELIHTVQVLNITGQTVFQTDVNDFRLHLDISNQPDGIYLISVVGNHGRSTKKMIIHH